jgi:hypothetical protein
MAYIQKDRVKETTTTNGTGAVTLAGAVAGFQAFSAVMSVADTCYYVIVSATGTDWETGTGTYSSASVLTRTTVLSSSNSGNAVSFTSGTKDVFMGPVAERVTDIAHGGTGATTAAGARTNLGVSTGTVTSVSGAGTVSGLTLTGTVTSSGSLTLGGTLSAIPLATGVSGTLPVANGGTGVTTSTGTTNVVLSNSPTLVTPLSNSLSAVPVASGAGNSVTIAAGSGVTSGAGGSLILQAGLQATSGGDGKINFKVGSLIVGSIESFSTTGGKLTLGDGFFTKTNGQNFSFSSGGLFSGVVSFTASITGGNGTVDGPSYLVDNDGKGHYFYSTSGITTLIGAFAKNGLIIIGGKTSSFPGLKRSGTQIQVRLADDSADASLSASNFVANALSAMPVTSGAGNSVTIAAGAGVGTGAGGSLILQAGLQATSGGDGKVIVKQVAGQTSNLQEWQNSAGTALASVDAAGNIKTTALTVATLTAAATAGAGARAFVSDSNATTFAAIVAGGGANGVPVYSDGTNWRIG